MIPVLCQACNTHLFNTDLTRLHFPLAGEMFDPVVPTIQLRPGYLNLDIFCPVCSAFPFWPDGTKTGFRGVGRYLKTQGPDGKPKIMSIDAIKMVPLFEQCKPGPDSDEPVIIRLTEDQAEKIKKSLETSRSAPFEPVEDAPEFPCPECGAKRNIHKRGCSHRPAAKAKDDPVLQSIIAKVEKTAGVAPDAPPTSGELSELAAERNRRVGKPSGGLRPIEG